MSIRFQSPWPQFRSSVNLQAAKCTPSSGSRHHFALLSAPAKDTVHFGSQGSGITGATGVTAITAEPKNAPEEVQQAIPINTFTQSQPMEATVVRNTVLNPQAPDPDTHEIVFKVDPKFYWEPGQCVKVITNKLNNDNTGLHEAAYSIASHHNPETNELALFVKRLKQRDDKGAINYWGRCSNFLCDSKPGEKIKIYGPQNDTLVLPKRNNINVVAVCGGTGLAPIRAILPDRKVSQGGTMVFYGVKNQENYAYQKDLEEIALQDPSTIKLFVGFSDKSKGATHQTLDNRSDEEQELPELRHLPDVNYRWGGYITESIKENAETVLEQLESPKTYFVFCGSKAMLNGVTEALEKACEATQRDWKQLYAKMISEGRWRVEAA